MRTVWRRTRRRKQWYLFSGLTKCSVCGGGYVICWGEKLACFNSHSRGTRSNRLTISRGEIEERVLTALRDKLMRKDLFEEFCHEYTREMNRLRMARRAAASRARAELAKVEKDIRQIVEAIKAGGFTMTMRHELVALEQRQAS
jgi:hypothetical protein